MDVDKTQPSSTSQQNTTDDIPQPSDITQPNVTETQIMPERDSSRTRTFTDKGFERYQDQLDKLFSMESKSWSAIEVIVHEIEERDTKDFRDLKLSVRQLKEEFLSASHDVTQFLERKKYEESKLELSDFNERFKRKCRIITRLQRRIDETLLEVAESVSIASSSSSAARKKRMEAEIQKTKLEFIKAKVRLEGQMQILEQSEKVAVAEAEARVLEETEVSGSHRLSLPDVEHVSRKEHVVSYLNDLSVNDHRDMNVTETQSTYKTHEHLQHAEPSAMYSSVTNTYPMVSQATVTTPFVPQLSTLREFPSMTTVPAANLGTYANNTMSQGASLLHPTLDYPTVSSQQVSQNHMTTFSNYLMKKELMISRFTNFNDEPESYNSWKMNFQSIVRDLNVSDFEQIQLLVRWLGPQSSKYAENIRQANPTNPTEGLRMIWTWLEQRYGAAELIDSSLRSKLERFPSLTIKDTKKLFELADILSQVDAIKKNPTYAAMFAYYDTSVGIIPIASKLPYQWREKWTSKASDYKAKHMVPYPPFSIFVAFVQDLSRVRNDPGFQYLESDPKKRSEVKPIRVKKTDLKTVKPQVSKDTKTNKCPIHEGMFHSLKSCRKFRTLSLEEKKKILKENKLCYKCCGDHFAKVCNATVKCEICSSEKHHTSLHPQHKYGGEETAEETAQKAETVDSKCTVVCGNNFPGKSCAKTLLVNVYPSGRKHQSKRLYVILDDQSSQTLAKPEFFDMFGVSGTSINYTLSSCSGTVSMSGRCGSNFVVEPIGNGRVMNISRVIECEDIPSNKEEIPSPEVARAYPHLANIADEIPAIDSDANILLLIGRDHPDFHHVLHQLTGPSGFPFAQRLPLGWSIIGECCLGKVHPPKRIVSNKTYVLPTGQVTVLPPCPTHLNISKTCQNDLFALNEDDNQPGPSVEDREFLQIMDKDCFRDEKGFWTAPLPFRETRSRLPNNRDQAVKRMQSLISSFKRNPTKRDDAINFMDRVLRNGHAEIAPPLDEGEECWFLPIFGVYHPRKPTQIRMVFDASASYFGKSLNSVLLQGPNLTNSLLGILLRFRRERVAVVGDIFWKVTKLCSSARTKPDQ